MTMSIRMALAIVLALAKGEKLWRKDEDLAEALRVVQALLDEQ